MLFLNFVHVFTVAAVICTILIHPFPLNSQHFRHVEHRNSHLIDNRFHFPAQVASQVNVDNLAGIIVYFKLRFHHMLKNTEAYSVCFMFEETESNLET